MSDFGSDAVLWSAILFTIVPCAVCLISFATIDMEMITAKADKIEGLKKAKNRYILATIPFLAFGWLLGPWIGFLLWTIGCKSIAAINYIQRPEEVVPVTRPIVDLNKESHVPH